MQQSLLTDVAEVWAIKPEWLRDALSLWASGAIEDRPAAAAPTSQTAKGAVAVLPVHGPISQRATFFTVLFGGSTTEGISAQMKALVYDPTVKAIVLDINSPGGSVSGVLELGEEIRAMRGSKPIVAVANSLAASAAYWIASQADEIAVTPSGEVGSVGVFSLHLDLSQRMQQLGIKPTYIQFGENKTLGNAFEPLGDKAREELQSRVDAYGHDFVQAVAIGRGVTRMKVLDVYGQGLVFGAKDAVERGMADRVATLSEVLEGLSVNPLGRGNRRAELQREVQRAGLG